MTSLPPTSVSATLTTTAQPIQDQATLQKLERIFNFFTTRALVIPWLIHTHVTGHHSPEILAFVVSKWPTIEHHPSIRAGFLLSLVSSPRTRIAASHKPCAEQLVALGMQDRSDYVRLVATMVGSCILSGHLSADVVGAFSHVFAPIFTALDNAYARLTFLPKELAVLNKSARSRIMICQPGRPGSLSSPDRLSPPVVANSGLAFEFKPEHAIPPIHVRLKSYGIDYRPEPSSQSSGTPSSQAGRSANLGSHSASPASSLRHGPSVAFSTSITSINKNISSIGHGHSGPNSSSPHANLTARKRPTPSFLRSSHPKIMTHARRLSQASSSQPSGRPESAGSVSPNPSVNSGLTHLGQPRTTSLSAPNPQTPGTSPHMSSPSTNHTAADSALSSPGHNRNPPPRYVKQARIQLMQVDEVNSLLMRDATNRRKSVIAIPTPTTSTTTATDDGKAESTEKRRRKSKTDLHNKSDESASDDDTGSHGDVSAAAADGAHAADDQQRSAQKPKRKRRTTKAAAAKSATGKKSSAADPSVDALQSQVDSTPSRSPGNSGDISPVEAVTNGVSSLATPPAASTPLPSFTLRADAPVDATTPLSIPPQVASAQQSQGQGPITAPPSAPANATPPPSVDSAPAAKAAPPVPTFRLEDILIGSQNVSEPDVRLIDDFLHGKYIKREEVKEIKLSERIYTDIENDVTKRETMWILLDYTQCRWRKVKRTAKVLM